MAASRFTAWRSKTWRLKGAFLALGRLVLFRGTLVGIHSRLRVDSEPICRAV